MKRRALGMEGMLYYLFVSQKIIVHRDALAA